MRRFVSYLALPLALCVPAFAESTFYGSGSGFGSNGQKEALVEFSVSGTDLLVTLTNVAASDVLVPADVLTAVFFSVDGPNLSLARTSAVLANGSIVYYDPDGQPVDGIVGGEWAYRSGIGGGPNNLPYGISSVGLGLFGPGDRFPGPDLEPPASPDGLQYGLLSDGDDVATGNGGVMGSGGLIKNAVTFTLSGLPVGFSLSSITDVYFLYGTSLDEGGFEGHKVPEPAGLILLLCGLGLLIRRR